MGFLGELMTSLMADRRSREASRETDDPS